MEIIAEIGSKTLLSATVLVFKRHFNIIDIDEKRMKNIPTVPTNVAIEKLTNPFVRANDSNIKEELNMMDHSDIEIFTEIRKRKDIF